MPGTLEEPILSRLNRLDNILRELEDIRSGQHSPKSWYASTTSSGTLTSDGLPEISPERLEKRCRPVDEVMMEVDKKGNLIDRLLHAEDRILKLCLQMEEEYHHEEVKIRSNSDSIKSPKKGLRQLVKSCVRPKSDR